MRFYVGETEIYASFWFFAVIAVFASLHANVLLLYFAVPAALHELGHLAALFLFKIKIKAVRFTAFGVEIEKDKRRMRSLSQEIMISLGGILFNLIAALVLYFTIFKSMRGMLLISANLAVALFNLLPIGNLDGGEIARAVSEYYFKPRAAYVLSRVFSFAVLIPLFAAAIFLMLLPERNFTLLAVCCYLLIDIMVKG